MAIEITNECNMALMARYPDKYFDLAIVDPPYGINADIKNSDANKKSKHSASKSKKYGEQKWDDSIPDDEYFSELFRVSKHQIIWGANYFGLIGGYIYWDKCVTMPTYSDGELAYCSLLNSIKSFKFAWHGMIQQNMKDKEHRIHPTQKPVGLYKWLLDTFSKTGFKILDTHLGSGSIAIACHDRKIDLVACELDKDYYDAAVKRLKQHQAQTTMF
jgi:site-specific DNA-methyltransferase (adenine-specific)